MDRKALCPSTILLGHRAFCLLRYKRAFETQKSFLKARLWIDSVAALNTDLVKFSEETVYSKGILIRPGFI